MSLLSLKVLVSLISKPGGEGPFYLELGEYSAKDCGIAGSAVWK
jgi:hypothetical protein